MQLDCALGNTEFNRDDLVGVAGGEAQFFVDVRNVLNHRTLEWAAFMGDWDPQRYLWSLHLPEDTFEGYPGGMPPYLFVPGHDRMGDYRKPGTPFVPVEVAMGALPEWGEARALYYLVPAGAKLSGGTYHRYRDGAWEEADRGFVREVLANKQYIDMPNKEWMTFMWPRSFHVGLRFSF